MSNPSCVVCTNMFYPNVSNDQCDNCCAEEVNREIMETLGETGIDFHPQPESHFDYDDGDNFMNELDENAEFEGADERYGIFADDGWYEDYGGECG